MTSRKRSSDTEIVHSTSSYEHDINTINAKSTFGSANSTTDPITSTRELSSRPKLQVKIKRWHGVAHWSWNCGEEDEVCGICQSAYEGVAPGIKYPGDECPVVWGKCGHSFHLQCVTTWLATRSTCPFCRTEWEFGERSVQE